jgi:pentatricopeptide repeat protein
VGRWRDAPLTSALHATLLKSEALHGPQPLAASNSLLHAYLQCGLLSPALRLLNAGTYTSLISRHCRLSVPVDAFHAFLDMLAWGAGQGEDDGAVCPNKFTAAALLQACGLTRDERLGRMLHGYLVVGGWVLP